MKSPAILILPVLALCYTACEKKPTTQAAPTPAAGSLDPFFTTTPPSSPAAIHTVRANAKPGDTITVTGLVMGREAPFVEGRAAFVIGDRSVLTPCNETPGDQCATPWDVCCDSTEDKQRATATIQLLDKSGRVIKQGLKGSHGLTELSTVTLTGAIDKASTPEVLIINATQLHVTPRKP
jgi:hypothetical protein